MNLPNLPPVIYLSVVVSLTVAVLLVLTKGLHGRFSMDGLEGIQKMHNKPTPRVGGVAIFAGVIAGWYVAPAGVDRILGVLIIAGLPAFLFGLAEDLTKQVSVMARLLATMASGAFGWWMTGYSLTNVGVPPLDLLLAWLPVSVIFTAFAVGGVANAVNIIDGFNGLASGFVVLALCGLGAISSLQGDTVLGVSCLAIAASVVGFWLVNWPLGKIFLGDGGSYFAGFALAWASVLLLDRSRGVTAFAPLLVCTHPVTEVLFSIYRRRLKKAHPGHPDRLHLHSLIMRRFVTHVLLKINGGRRKKMLKTRNAVTGLVLTLMSVPNVLVAVWVANDVTLAALACIVFSLGYVTIYARLVRFGWCSPLSFLFVKNKSITI